MKWIMVITLLIITSDVFGHQMTKFTGYDSIKEFKGYQNLDVFVAPLKYLETLDTEKRLLKIRTKRFLKEEMDWEMRDINSIDLTERRDFLDTHPFAIEVSSQIAEQKIGDRVAGYTVICRLDILDYVDERRGFVIIYNHSSWVTGPSHGLRESYKMCNERLLDTLLLDYYDA